MPNWSLFYLVEIDALLNIIYVFWGFFMFLFMILHKWYFFWDLCILYLILFDTYYSHAKAWIRSFLLDINICVTFFLLLLRHVAPSKIKVILNTNHSHSDGGDPDTSQWVKLFFTVLLSEQFYVLQLLSWACFVHQGLWQMWLPCSRWKPL